VLLVKPHILGSVNTRLAKDIGDAAECNISKDSLLMRSQNPQNIPFQACKMLYVPYSQTLHAFTPYIPWGSCL